MSLHANWSDKRVLLLGFGAEGRSNLLYAAKCGAREIAIADQASSVTVPSDDAHLITRVFSGVDWLAGLYDYDIIIRSPGVPLRHLSNLPQAAPQTVVTSGTDIFLGQHRDRTIGITGTKGKSTTSSLIYHILTRANIAAQLGGNIGIPALNLLDTRAAVYVLELSSYQLADVRTSPHIAVLLNLYPEHLDHHGSFELYGAAKASISRFQTHQDTLVLPSGSEHLQRLTESSSAQRVLWGTPNDRSWIEQEHFYYRCAKGLTHKVCSITTPLLKGPGNQRNILAALAAISHLSLPTDVLAQALASFRPLPHRLEEVAVTSGVTFINDSISTVPEATINALETFGPLVGTVLLGGFDRGVSFAKLADYLMQTNVKTILLFPPSGTRIAQALKEHPLFSSNPRTIIEVSSMQDAVYHARVNTPPGSICLLSPASPSFPLFKNFEERGAAFRDAVLSKHTPSEL